MNTCVQPLSSTFSFDTHVINEVPILRGVKQGDPLSGFLFACMLDYDLSGQEFLGQEWTGLEFPSRHCFGLAVHGLGGWYLHLCTHSC